MGPNWREIVLLFISILSILIIATGSTSEVKSFVDQSFQQKISSDNLTSS